MNVYLITATTYECESPEGERYAMFVSGANARKAFEAYAESFINKFDVDDAHDRPRMIELMIEIFDHAMRKRHNANDDVYDFFDNNENGATRFTIVRVAAEGERDKHVRRALADSLAQAFDV